MQMLVDESRKDDLGREGLIQPVRFIAKKLLYLVQRSGYDDLLAGDCDSSCVNISRGDFAVKGKVPVSSR